MTQTWKNWSGSQSAKPQHIYYPDRINVLQQIVQCHSKIRVVGAGHSFSPLVATNDTLISLDNLQGLISQDRSTCQSQLYAGTRLYALADMLQPTQQALINQGDIDQQSLAGALSTGTHGTGASLQCLSAMLTGFELLTADGELLWCDANEHTEIFNLGRVALGSLGILTKVTMQNRPAYRLHEQQRLCPLREVLDNIMTWKDQHRHVEFWAFLHADQVILKTLDDTTDEILPRKEPFPSDDTILTLCCELVRLFPKLNATLQSTLKYFVKPTQAIDWSGKIFPTPRNTRFNEMEYQIPVEQGIACFEEVLATLLQHHVPMFFPIEFRFVKGDDIALSPFYGRDSVSISIHQYHKQDYQQIFSLVEPIFLKYQGRPHWGKLHTQTAKTLQNLYPKWDEFQQLRQQLDPSQKWLNPHLQNLFLD